MQTRSLVLRMGYGWVKSPFSITFLKSIFYHSYNKVITFFMSNADRILRINELLFPIVVKLKKQNANIIITSIDKAGFNFLDKITNVAYPANGTIKAPLVPEISIPYPPAKAAIKNKILSDLFFI